MRQFGLLCIILFFLCGCGNNNQDSSKVPVNEVKPMYYSVTNRLPHDINSFTEGFLIYNNQLFESTGSPDNLPHTRSIFGHVDLKTGKIDIKIELNRNEFFGEGIVFLKNKLYQLTYKNQLCFVYDAKTFKKTGQFKYPNKEGWGLTTDGTYIIMSDGTNVLSFIEPSNFRIIKSLAITENNFAVDYLNELEYIKGFIYANVWPTNTIVKINPANGHVVSKNDFSPLKDEASAKNSGSYEMNGIAYDSLTDKVYLTGKMWPQIFEVDIISE